jgi:hypothetical protein
VHDNADGVGQKLFHGATPSCVEDRRSISVPTSALSPSAWLSGDISQTGPVNREAAGGVDYQDQTRRTLATRRHWCSVMTLPGRGRVGALRNARRADGDRRACPRG